MISYVHRYQVACETHLINLLCVLQRTLEFNIGNNQKVKEDVGADVKENYVRYHVKDENSEVTVIEDFNRVGISLFLSPVGVHDIISRSESISCCLPLIRTTPPVFLENSEPKTGQEHKF